MTTLARRGRQASVPHHIDSHHVADEGAYRQDPTEDEGDSRVPHELSQDEDDSQTTRVEATDIEKGKERERPIGNLRRQTTAKDFIVGFEGPNDPLNARNWPFRKKAYVTFLLGSLTMGSQFASSVLSAGSAQIVEEFGISDEVAVLGTSLFVLAYIFSPAVWSALSESYGRKWSVLLPYLVFISFTAASGASKSVDALFITRFFGGLFAAAPVVNVGGALADLFEPKSRATAVVAYSVAVVAVIGSSVSSSYLGWRWTMWITVILCSTILVLCVFFLPETYGPALLSRKATRLRLETNNWALRSRHEMQDFSLQVFARKNVTLPMRLLITEPICLAVVFYNAFVYSLLYVFFSVLPVQFSEIRGWDPVPASLPFLSVMLGCFIAGAVNILYSEKVYVKKVEASPTGDVEPEWRLPPMMVGAVLFPIGLFWFAWTSNPQVSWVNQVLAIGVTGIAFLLIFQAGLNYLLDVFAPVAASVVAANTFLRSAFAGGFPLFSLPFVHNLGMGASMSIIGGVSVLLAFVPFLFWKYGRRLREASKGARKDA